MQSFFWQIFVICDEFGYCDTSYIYVVTLFQTDGDSPIAIDNDTTVVLNTPVTINVLANDTINGSFFDISVVDEPLNGTAIVNSDFTVTYLPNRDFCESQDSFTYELSTSTGKDTATVTIDVLCDELTIFSGFSPNGDGVNDVFTILGIENFPNNTVRVYNRWGNEVYMQRGYTMARGWDGSWDGDHLPDGTYFYLVEDGEGNKFSGYVQLHR